MQHEEIIIVSCVLSIIARVISDHIPSQQCVDTMIIYFSPKKISLMDAPTRSFQCWRLKG
jgi:hypothetical protein